MYAIRSYYAPFVHEPFGLELKVYLRDGVQIDGNFGIRGGLPESGLDGELQWQVAGRARAEISGAIFNVYTLRSTAKALTAGTFTFQPQVQLNIVIPRQNRVITSYSIHYTKLYEAEELDSEQIVGKILSEIPVP